MWKCLEPWLRENRFVLTSHIVHLRLFNLLPERVFHWFLFTQWHQNVLRKVMANSHAWTGINFRSNIWRHSKSLAPQGGNSKRSAWLWHEWGLCENDDYWWKILFVHQWPLHQENFWKISFMKFVKLFIISLKAFQVPFEHNLLIKYFFR